MIDFLLGVSATLQVKLQCYKRLFCLLENNNCLICWLHMTLRMCHFRKVTNIKLTVIPCEVYIFVISLIATFLKRGSLNDIYSQQMQSKIQSQKTPQHLQLIQVTFDQFMCLCKLNP